MTTKTTTNQPAKLEHVNLTVSNPQRTADLLIDLFDWHIRWSGGAIHGGHTIHVGSDDDYLALYSLPDSSTEPLDTYHRVTGLNHIAFVVDDLDDIERRVIAAGFEPVNHGDYEPGRRFYFRDHDHVEYEIVSYV